MALGVEPGEVNAMRRPPRDPKRRLLEWPGILMVATLGSYIGLATLWLFHAYLQSSDPREAAAAGTVAFTAIVLMEKINVLNFRSLREPVSSIGVFSNPWILAAMTSMIGLQVAAVYVPAMQSVLHTVPLTATDWGLLLVIALPIFVITESIKWIVGRFQTTGQGDTMPTENS